MTHIRRTILLLTVVLAAVPAVVAQHRMTLADAVTSAVARSERVDQAGLRVRLLELARESLIGSTRPEFTVSADPVYGVRTQRGSSFASITSIADFPPQTLASSTHTTGVGVSMRQALPTAGLLSASAGASLSATLSRPDDGDLSAAYSLSPTLSASLTQPLFVAGRFVDTGQAGLGLVAADVAIDGARIGKAATEEQIGFAVARLYVQLGSVRRATDLQRVQQALVFLQLDEARVRRDQGGGAQQLVTTLEIQLNRLRDAEYQSRLAAAELQVELSRLTGVEFSDDTELDLGVDLDALSPTTAPGEPSTLAIDQARSALREAQIEYDRSSRYERANARVALSLTPRYADQRESPDTLIGALTDYAGSGAGVNVVFSLGVDVPLGTEAARNRTVEQAAIAVALAESQIDALVREEAATRSVLDLRRQTALRRVELAEFDLSFELEQLEADRELRELGAATHIDVARREATIEGRRSDIETLRTELFLIALDQARLSGVGIVAFVSGQSSR